jgi:AAA+ ATPase superfamily predicted ATPase
MKNETNFVGRQREMHLLQEQNWRKQAQLVVIYGRRRVGKTALVRHAFKDQTIWEFDGLEGMNTQGQLKHFSQQLASFSKERASRKKAPKSWEGAFEDLQVAIQGKSVVIFFDEFQWMASTRSHLVSLFKSYWDRKFSTQPSCSFILCGSVSSFMVKKVLKSKALYGRIDKELHLDPLTLRDAHEFFKGKRSNKEILQITMVLGCIPQYLLELNPKYSFIQCLNEYAFSKNGYFVNEFQRLFVSHFGKNPLYSKVLRLLAEKTCRPQDLAKKLGVPTGGTFTSLLDELEWAGFIERFSSLNRTKEKTKFPRYRISDEYLHFYFKFIEPNLEAIQTGGFNFSQITGGLTYDQWQGFAFERLCRKNAKDVADFLRFSGIRYKSGSWFSTGRSSFDSPKKIGAQIDLLFERGDEVLTVCECKWVDRLNGQSVIRNFEQKLAGLQTEYPTFGIQKILILGKKIQVAESLTRYFDHILFAEEVFF